MSAIGAPAHFVFLPWSSHFVDSGVGPDGRSDCPGKVLPAYPLPPAPSLTLCLSSLVFPTLSLCARQQRREPRIDTNKHEWANNPARDLDFVFWDFFALRRSCVVDEDGKDEDLGKPHGWLRRPTDGGKVTVLGGSLTLAPPQGLRRRFPAFRHGHSLAVANRDRANLTASCNLRSSRRLGSTFVQ